MEFTFLNVFDQVRFMGGLLSANLLFSFGTSPKRKHFALCAVLGFLICLIVSQGYFFVCRLQKGSALAFALIGGSWWIALSFLGAVYILFLYKISVVNALYRNLLSCVLQQIPTVILRYLLDSTLFIGFSHRHPVWYVLTTLIVYGTVYLAVYFCFIRQIKKKGEYIIEDSKVQLTIQIVMMLLVSLVSNLIGGIFDSVLPSISADEFSLLELRLFCVGMQFIICFIVFILQYNMYYISQTRREQESVRRLFEERKRQYEISSDTIASIKKQSHNLKHQINALKMASEKERKAVFDEATHAVALYDCLVRTGNEVLDTILTEKSLQCMQRGIRLSCAVKEADLKFFSIIDLYTMLGNALENAMESVEKLQDGDKKVISFAVLQKANMVCFEVKNYFVGKVDLRKGLPKTTKSDIENHGIGLKSIQYIVRKYGGDMRIDVNDDIFDLKMIFSIN